MSVQGIDKIQNILVNQGGLDKVRMDKLGPGSYEHDPPKYRSNYYKNETSSFASKKPSLDMFVGGPAGEVAAYNPTTHTYSLPAKIKKS